MTTRIVGAVATATLALAAGCGGAVGATNLANFTGTPAWDGALSAGGTCDNGTTIPIVSVPASIVYSSTADNEIEYTNDQGCFFKFSVSGDTATLSNAPVKCSIVLLGLAVNLSYTKYTATTTDGHHLTAGVTYSTVSGAVSCTFTGNGSGTR